MSRPRVKVLFASGSQERIPLLIEKFKTIFPELPLWIVSEFPPIEGTWIPYHPSRSFRENFARCRAALRGKHIRLAAVLLEPRMPYWRMRLIPVLLTPLYLMAYNEQLDHWMLRPRSAPTMIRHVLWRIRNYLHWQLNMGGSVYTFFWRLAHPRALRRPLAYRAALISGRVAGLRKRLTPASRLAEVATSLEPGISVILRSQDSLAPGVVEQLADIPHEVVAAGGRVRFSHTFLLNGETRIEPGFFAALQPAFERVPDLFCATAQTPSLEGEDLSWVLHGRRGCSLYATGKLLSLGQGEDLDLGFRAWQQGWSTVAVAGARVLERPTPAITPRVDRTLELNYLRFLVRNIHSPATFHCLWTSAVRRLNLQATDPYASRVAFPSLVAATQAWRWVERAPTPNLPDETILALTDGSAAVFPGRRPSGRRVVLIASPYVPYPLAHGGAVRMFNLIRRAAAHYDQILVCFAEELRPVPTELLDCAVEVVLVKRYGSHSRPSTPRPEVVEEFDSLAFHAALRQTVRKWSPAIAQLEFTQMAQYAADCAPAKTILVEHDITFDLCQQLLQQNDDWELKRQLRRWIHFETDAWRRVDRVVTMSEKDRLIVSDSVAVCLANGVDIDRFRPSDQPPEPARVLFIGSFAHLPNLLAVEFFLKEVWPLLTSHHPVLHIIAGARHETYLRGAGLDLDQPGIEVDGFVADVRRAYQRATVVIAPLLASAGTNIKIMEAMAMGKAIVTTSAGINGLNLRDGQDVLVANTKQEMAAAIGALLEDSVRRQTFEAFARATAVRDYDWDALAVRQTELYQSLVPRTT